MRTLKNFMLLVMTLSLATFTSCSNDDDGGSGGNAPSGTLIAKVDGTSYESWEISSSATIANNGNNLIIIASNSDGNAFSFTVWGYDGVGTYDLDGSNINNVNVASYTETDDKLIGTFEFTCKNINGDQSVKTITDGSFNLNKQVQ